MLPCFCLVYTVVESKYRMREFMNIVTESDDPKALRARLRQLTTDRKYIIMSLCTGAAAKAATALAEGRTEDHAAAMERLTKHVESAAGIEREQNEILRKLGVNLD